MGHNYTKTDMIDLKMDVSDMISRDSQGHVVDTQFGQRCHSVILDTDNCFIDETVENFQQCEILHLS